MSASQTTNEKPWSLKFVKVGPNTPLEVGKILQSRFEEAEESMEEEENRRF
jgi:hypothetical protein